MLNIVRKTWRAEYRALHSVSEYSAVYRPGRLNIELYIQIWNIVLHIELSVRMLKIALNIDLEG